MRLRRIIDAMFKQRAERSDDVTAADGDRRESGRGLRDHDPHDREATMVNQRTVIYAVGAVIMVALVILFSQN